MKLKKFTALCISLSYRYFMPLNFIKYPAQDTCLGLWDITESLDELCLKYPMHEEKQDFLALKSEKRKKQWLAARVLVLEMMTQSNWPISHILKDIENKPYTENPTYFISISHSHQVVAAMISKKYPVGVDIENFDRDFQQVKNKFLNEKELAYVLDNDESACLYWTLKEAVYKVVGKPVYSFKETIFAEIPTENFIPVYIQPIDQQVKVFFLKQGVFYLSYLIKDGN